MIRFIYNLLWPLGLLFFLPGYLIKMFRRGGYRRKFGQRLGIYSADVRRRLAEQRSTWLRAVPRAVVRSLSLPPASRSNRERDFVSSVIWSSRSFAFSIRIVCRNGKMSIDGRRWALNISGFITQETINTTSVSLRIVWKF